MMAVIFFDSPIFRSLPITFVLSDGICQLANAWRSFYSTSLGSILQTLEFGDRKQDPT